MYNLRIVFVGFCRIGLLNISMKSKIIRKTYIPEPDPDFIQCANTSVHNHNFSTVTEQCRGLGWKTAVGSYFVGCL